jgi:hypothetical protein
MRQCTIGWAIGYLDQQWRIGAAAAPATVDAFFKLTPDALGRIARQSGDRSPPATHDTCRLAIDD